MRQLSLAFNSPLRTACAFLGLVFFGYMGFSLIHVFASARIMNHKATCSTNVRQLMLGLVQYSADWDETLPSSQRWATLSSAYGHQSSEATVWHCPDAPSPYSYAFNSALSSLSYNKLAEPAQVICLFEADATTWNATGGAQQLAKEERHPWGFHYGFADGHVNYHRASELFWQPILISIEKRP